MQNIINLGDLSNINYNFMQVTSLEKTFGKFGFGGNSYQSIDLSGVSYTEIQSYIVVQGIADLLGVSHTQIISLKAPQASANITGISIVDNKPVVKWAGHSLIYGVSYLNIDGKEDFAVVEYINGSINISETISGESLKLDYASGSYKILQYSEGEFSQLQSILGSKNLVEFVTGARKGG